MKVTISDKWTDEEKLLVIARISAATWEKRSMIEIKKDVELINVIALRTPEFLELNRGAFSEYIN